MMQRLPVLRFQGLSYADFGTTPYKIPFCQRGNALHKSSHTVGSLSVFLSIFVAISFFKYLKICKFAIAKPVLCRKADLPFQLMSGIGH